MNNRRKIEFEEIMTTKSVLFSTCAIFVTAGIAQAADLPMTKGEAVEYVKVCSEFGPGFFYIPGTDTCIQIGGSMRALYGYNNIPKGSYSASPGKAGQHGSARQVDQTAFQGRFQLNIDVRTQTEFGVLRSFLSLDANTGHSGTQTRPFGSVAGSVVPVDKAFIQFGGLTAGYAESQYAFYDNYYGDTILAPYAGSGQIGTSEQLAYTAQFGGGFSATVSLEDPAHSRTSLLGSNVLPAVTYAGTQIPDIIGNIAYSSGQYDKVQIMAAAHQIRTLGGDLNGGGNSKWGFAVGAGVSWEIPVLSGGYFAIEGSYSDGASGYTGANMNANSSAGSPADYDAFVINGETKTAKAWSAEGEAAINFTPNLQGMVFGSYAHYDAPGIVEAEDLGSGFNAFVVGANLKYTVVKGFYLIPEVSYEYTKAKIAGFNNIGGSGLFNNSKAKTDSILAGVEVRRTF
jgi:hypothetical protein